MSTFETFRYILNQSDPTKDAFNIINKIFLDIGAEIAKLDLLPTGEMKVTVKHDLR